MQSRLLFFAFSPFSLMPSFNWFFNGICNSTDFKASDDHGIASFCEPSDVPLQ